MLCIFKMEQRPEQKQHAGLVRAEVGLVYTKRKISTATIDLPELDLVGLVKTR